ncbi:PTS glucose transporter subunit IIA [Bacillus sp. N9]
MILGFEDPVDERTEQEDENEENVNNVETVSASIGSEQVINSPITGKVVDLQEVADGVFSEKLLGEGIAIIPSDGKVYAPASGVMSTVFPTKHAYGITTANGADILIHIGINTVELNGELFVAHVEQDQHVKAGDLIAEFDLEQIKAKGYPIYTPVIMTNAASFADVSTLISGDVKYGEPLINLK